MPKNLLSPSFGGTFGNFRPLSLLLRLASIFIETCTITSNARYRQLVNTIMLVNTLAILRSTFGNFRPLSLTTSACVNLHILNLLLLRKRAMVNHQCLYKLRSVKWTLSPSFGNTFGNFLPLSLTSSACVKYLHVYLPFLLTNRRYFICLCHNEYSRHLLGVLSVTFDHYRYYFDLHQSS